MPYFAKLGFRCPKEFNPADFLLETISIDTRSEEALRRSSARVHALQAAHAASSRKRKLQRCVCVCVCVCVSVCKESGMKVNASKTKLMVINGTPLDKIPFECCLISLSERAQNTCI